MSDYELSQEQYQNSQKVISEYWGRMARITAERIFFDEEASMASPDDAEVFRLPALDADMRLANEMELESGLRKIAGDKAAKDLVRGVTSGAAFGCFGRYDVVFRFRPKVVREFDLAGNQIGVYVDKTDLMVSYDFMSPKSGEIILTGNSTSKDLTEEYGNIFVNPGE
jgi:hypothetical protein